MKTAQGCRVRLAPLLAGLLLLAAAPRSALAEDAPNVAKDSVLVTAKASTCSFGEKGCDKKTQFLDPYIKFRVNGPIASGSQLSVEFTVPGKPARKWDCYTNETAAGAALESECGSKATEGSRGFAFQGPPYTGPVGFSIAMRNELAGTKATLLAGKVKVGKWKSAPKAAEFDYYVDEDWRVPIGYLFFDTDSPSSFHALFWFRGFTGDVSAHLFYKGKEVAKQDGPAGVGEKWNPAPNTWLGADCKFASVLAEDPSSVWGPNHPPVHLLAKNPGEYEIKVLAGGHLARSVKFTVAENGTFDNGTASANKLGSKRVIVPVTMIGDQGPWNKQAWKKDAFYGNPLTGFAGP